MKRAVIKILVLISLLLGMLGSGDAATMEQYCQIPPFVTPIVPPNILMVVDVSGSMGWSAYNPDSTGHNWCADVAGCGNPYTGAEEGYFDPTKVYRWNAAGSPVAYWEETAGAVTACPNERGGISTLNLYDGGCLNYQYMSRLDLLRWAMTGGRPGSCTGGGAFNYNQCDPELWDQTGNSSKVGKWCNNVLGGCVLYSSEGYYVLSPWDRVNSGIAFKFKDYEVDIRMGGLFYSDLGVRADKVYIGDFTASNNVAAQFPYRNLITQINSHAPAGTTPTGPAMWDALNYYAQQPPEYGGFTEQSGGGSEWRNPVFQCFDTDLNGQCSASEYQFIPCAKNFVILLSDGQWNRGGTSGSVIDTCNIDDGFELNSADPVVAAYRMHQGFTNNFTSTATKVHGVYSIGLFLGGSGSLSMQNVGMYGAFEGSATWPDSLTGYPDDTCVADDCSALAKGSPCEPLPASSKDWDANSDGLPDTFYDASDASGIKKVIIQAIADLLRRASAGSAVSVLASGEEKGANMLQAVFYPTKAYGVPGSDTEIAWTGRMQNLWFYIDPNLGVSNIREDTVQDRVLDLDEDLISLLYFDTVEGKTQVARCLDSDGDGDCDIPQSTIDFEELKNLWEVGDLLFVRSASDRKIFTNLDDDTALEAMPHNDPALGAFVIDSDATTSKQVWELLDAPNDTVAKEIVKYVRGEDSQGYCSATEAILCTIDTDCPAGESCSLRTRTATIDVKACAADPTRGCTTDADCAPGDSCTVQSLTNTWKLGDIISSTPRLISRLENNDYYNRYVDGSYRDYLNTPDYKNRGMVVVGANDGMLHALKLGMITPIRNYADKTLVESLDGVQLGKEEWGFIPKNALPYLKYLMRKDYCHIYYIDATPYIVDASLNYHTDCSLAGITPSDYDLCSKQLKTDALGNMDFDNSSWRTIVIGSMRVGGACKDLGAGDPAKNVEVPVDGAGFSSYFALDITKNLTDPTQEPELLWEFSDADLSPAERAAGWSLGFSTTGPVVGRINARVAGVPDPSKNGKWFVVITSGPTGPITPTHEFLGESDQAMKIFVLDLAGDPASPGKAKILRKIDTGLAPLTLGPSFGNLSFNPVADLEWTPFWKRDYEDDVMYLGYSEGVKSGGSFDFQNGKGGILRLVTNGDRTGAAWAVTQLITTDNPVSSSIAKVRDDHGWGGRFWITFGTGRFFYRADMPHAEEYLVSVADPCYDSANRRIDMAKPACSVLTLGDLWDSTDSPPTSAFVSAAANHPDNGGTYHGWKVKLSCGWDDGSAWCTWTHVDKLNGERVITNPLAVGFGNKSLIYFTSFSPTDDACSFGGLTYLWAVDHSTGDAADLSLLRGKALIQVSTGEIKEVDLSTAFTERVSTTGEMRGRRTVGFKGVPPTGQGLSVIVQPEGMKRILHMMER